MGIWEKITGKKGRPTPADKEIRAKTVEQQRFTEPFEQFASKVRERIAENKECGELSQEEQERVFTAIVEARYVRSYDVTQSVIRETITKVLDRKPLPSGAAEPVEKARAPEARLGKPPMAA